MIFTSTRYPSYQVKVGSGKDIIKADGNLRTVVPPVYLRFTAGVLNCNNEGHVEALLHHPSYNVDFFGPFSRAQVADGSYKKELSKHLKTLESDAVVPDIDALVEAAKIVGARAAVGVTSHSLNENRIQSNEIRTVSPPDSSKKE